MRHFVAVLFTISALTLLVSPSLAAEKQTGYDAKFVKMNDIPRKLLAGQVFYVEYTMRNTGSEGWGPDNEKHTVLRSREPDDNKTWGTFFITTVILCRKDVS